MGKNKKKNIHQILITHAIYLIENKYVVLTSNPKEEFIINYYDEDIKFDRFLKTNDISFLEAYQKLNIKELSINLWKKGKLIDFTLGRIICIPIEVQNFLPEIRNKIAYYTKPSLYFKCVDEFCDIVTLGTNLSKFKYLENIPISNTTSYNYYISIESFTDLIPYDTFMSIDDKDKIYLVLDDKDSVNISLGGSIKRTNYYSFKNKCIYKITLF